MRAEPLEPPAVFCKQGRRRLPGAVAGLVVPGGVLLGLVVEALEDGSAGWEGKVTGRSRGIPPQARVLYECLVVERLERAGRDSGARRTACLGAGVVLAQQGERTTRRAGEWNGRGSAIRRPLIYSSARRRVPDGAPDDLLIADGFGSRRIALDLAKVSALGCVGPHRYAGVHL